MDLKFYRPYKDGNGSAAQFGSRLYRNEHHLEVTIAKQNAVKTDNSTKCFDWKNAQKILLDCNELAAICCAVEFGEKEKKFFHKSPSKPDTSRAFKIVQSDKNDGSFLISVGTIVNSAVKQNTFMLSPQEVWLLRQLAIWICQQNFMIPNYRPQQEKVQNQTTQEPPKDEYDFLR